MNIGQRIKERRSELGMSADKLADKLGKNRSTIYRYENGAIENMPLDILEPIAKALNTTPAYLMGWDKNEIDYVAHVQEDAAEYTASNEKMLKDFMIEISEMGFDQNEIKRIREYAHIIKHNEKNHEEIHKAFIDLFTKMYDLGLTLENLDEIYTYAQFLKSKNQ